MIQAAVARADDADGELVKDTAATAEPIVPSGLVCASVSRRDDAGLKYDVLVLEKVV